MGLISLLVRGAAYSAGVLVAILGLWVTTSLAVYHNVSVLLAIAIGMVPLAVVPAVLEIHHRIDRRRYGESRAYHAPMRRRLLRWSLIINAALLVGLLLSIPKAVSTALSTRGDWFLEGMSQTIRGPLLAVVDDVGSSLEPEPDNPFDEFDDGAGVDPVRHGPSAISPPVAPPVAPPPPSPPPPPPPPAPPPPIEVPPPPPIEVPPPPPIEVPPPPPPVVSPPPPPPIEVPPPSRPPDEGHIVEDREHGVPLIVVDGREPPPPVEPPIVPSEPASGDRHYVEWISEPSPHAVVRTLPSRVETSYGDVARYIASRESDPYERVKAIHDYLAIRIDYEYPFDRSRLPPSDPDTVFARRVAVCAGYARLFQAMVEAIGGRAVYISGDARFATESVAGASHAWNAVEIEGRWYLVDVTWDAGFISGGKFKKKYRTDFLLTPPQFFVISHLPASPKWQLLDEPKSRGEFYRQPLLFPSFIAFDLRLIDPSRSQITVSGTARVVLGNPGTHSIVVEQLLGGSLDRRQKCDVEEVNEPRGRSAGARTVATCGLAEDGDYVLYVFAALRGEVVHELVAKLEVNNDV